jgi:hypothetical protein
MTRADWTRIKRIAGEAWDLPDSERDAYVVGMCADNEPLRIEVMHLLRAMTAAAGCFEDVVIGSVPRLGEEPRSGDLSATDHKRDRFSGK